MSVSSENIAQHLVAFGYTAKPGTLTDKKTGDVQQVVFINGLGSINAYINLSDDPAKFGLKVFGNLQEGYAPVLLDASGEVIRETITQNGETVTRAKRGEPLDAEALKRKNTEISLTARKEITGAVLAAYMLEVGGGDLEKVRDGFRLQKWTRSERKLDSEAGEIAEGEAHLSTVFREAAAPQADTSAVSTGRKIKRSASAPKI